MSSLAVTILNRTNPESREPFRAFGLPWSIRRTAAKAESFFMMIRNRNREFL